MRRLNDHLRLAHSVIISNIWLLEDGFGRRFLVDTGHLLERYALMASLHRAGIKGPGDLTAILLTHRHSDHAGNAAYLRAHFDCPVICHADDAQVLSGAAPRDKMAKGKARFHEELLCHIEDHFPALSPVDETYGKGDWKWGFHIVEVPGHTPGSVMLHHDATRTLFSGDAILTGIPPVRALEVIRLAEPGFSDDTESCRALVREYLRQMPPTDAVCSGHGPLVHKRASEKLRKLC